MPTSHEQVASYAADPRDPALTAVRTRSRASGFPTGGIRMQADERSTFAVSKSGVFSDDGYVTRGTSRLRLGQSILPNARGACFLAAYYSTRCDRRNVVERTR
jgi:hypothetical protein